GRGRRGCGGGGPRDRRPGLVLLVRTLSVFRGRRAGVVDRARQGLLRPARRLGRAGGRALQSRALPPPGRRVPPHVQLRGDGAGGAGGGAGRAGGGERAGDAAVASEFRIPAAGRTRASLSAAYCSTCKLLSTSAM